MAEAARERVERVRAEQALEVAETRLAASEARARELEAALGRTTQRLAGALWEDEQRERAALAELRAETKALEAHCEVMEMGIEHASVAVRKLRGEADALTRAVRDEVGAVRAWVEREVGLRLEAERANALAAMEAVAASCGLETDLDAFLAAITAAPLDTRARAKFVASTRCAEMAQLRERVRVAERDAVRAKRVALRLKRVRDRDFEAFSRQMRETEEAFERFKMGAVAQQGLTVAATERLGQRRVAMELRSDESVGSGVDVVDDDEYS